MLKRHTQERDESERAYKQETNERNRVFFHIMLICECSIYNHVHMQTKLSFLIRSQYVEFVSEWL